MRLKKDGTPAKKPGKKPSGRPPSRPKKGFGPGVPRPHVWIYKDPLLHDMHLPFLRAKAQAIYREEGWTLTIEEFHDLWKDHWHERGRKGHEYCMSRYHDDKPWTNTNTRIITRREHLINQGFIRKSKNGTL